MASRLADDRLMRGSSNRGISYYDKMKNSAPSYGTSIKKTNNIYVPESGPTYLRNPPKLPSNNIKSSAMDYQGHGHGLGYQYGVDRTRQSRTGVGVSDQETRFEGKDSRNQQFRIRANTKDKEMANSRKTEKEEEEKNGRQKQLSEIRKKVQLITLQKQRSQQNIIQKLIKQKQARESSRKQSTPMGQTSCFPDTHQHQPRKPNSIMTNSTGTSDHSGSSVRNGNIGGSSHYGFSTSSSKSVGLVGLNNIGNTCFMNSILQCMFNLPGFNEYFINGKYLSELKSSGRVAEAYARTVKTIRGSTSRSETPSQLKSAIAAKKSRFQGYSQQDAQQFLAALLQLLSSDLNRSKNPKYKQLTADLSKQSLKQISDDWWNYNKQREDSIVSDYFTGQVLSRVVCSKCNNESIAFDNIWDMALNFSANDGGDLSKMISNFLKEETIADDYYCLKCKNFRQCVRKIDFFRLPKILVFQLKRFSYGKYRKVKLNNRVCLKTHLDLSPFIKYSHHSSVNNPVYQLVGVVNHSGDIDFGHYTAQCRNPINGKWYDFNDSSVHEISMREQMASSSPYLLFYAKKQIC